MNPQSIRSDLAADSVAPPKLRGHWLVLAQVGWVLLTGLSVALFAASVPLYYAQVRSFSTATMHAPDAVKVGLEQLGISFGAYAAYWMAALVALMTVFVGMGAIIFWRKRDDRAALYFSLTLVVFGAIWPNTLGTLANVHPVLYLLITGLESFGLIAFFLLFYLFPNGQFVPRWTRFVAAAFIVSTALAMFFPGSLVDIENWPPPFNLLGTVEIAFFFGTMIYGQIHRYRRVSGAVERQQTKWVVSALVVAIVCFIGTGALGELPVFNQPVIPAALFALSSFIGYGVAFMLVPITIGIAVLRYRLWDIDLIINRALVYGVLTACVVGIYVLVVGYLGALLRTDDNLLISLAATGLVAIFFAPLRDRLQRGANRLMYGERDDPYKVISRLGERLEATLAPESVLPIVTRTVREALKLPYAAIALAEGKNSTVVAESGSPVDTPLRLPLVYQGVTAGELLLGPRVGEEDFSPADRRLLDDLTHQAGVAVHAVRLTNALQRSRERLVTAREEERRRLRRDLHDGLGPTLGSLPLKLDLAGDLLESDPAAARELLRGLKAQAKSAVADIRRLVYALRPPALDDLGLLGAIRETVAQYTHNGLHASVEAPESLPPLPAAVEVAAYLIVQEAVTNVSRHAGAQNCTIRLSLDGPDGELRLEIEDDGRGIGPRSGRGVGIASMRERASELGGECVVESLSGGGTRVYASLPRAAPEQER